jgi:hypothetical protein
VIATTGYMLWDAPKDWKRALGNSFLSQTSMPVLIRIGGRFFFKVGGAIATAGLAAAKELFQ